MLRLFFPLLTAVCVALSGCAGVSPEVATAERHLSLTEVRLDPEEARELINRYRAEKGLPPLALEARLTEAARRHSADLARHDRISHRGSDGSDPWVRVKKVGYRPQLAAENVGVGQRSLAELFRDWQASPGHNKNLLLPDATQMGIALVKEAGTRYGTFWTLVLGTPL